MEKGFIYKSEHYDDLMQVIDEMIHTEHIDSDEIVGSKVEVSKVEPALRCIPDIILFYASVLEDKNQDAADLAEDDWLGEEVVKTLKKYIRVEELKTALESINMWQSSGNYYTITKEDFEEYNKL